MFDGDLAVGSRVDVLRGSIRDQPVHHLAKQADAHRRLLGRGLGNGTQTQGGFVPFNHTDFVFSVVGEEFGFLGTVFVLGLFTLLIVRGLRIAADSRDPFAGLTVVGILSMLAFQVFVNIGVTVGLVPVTGLPLPIYSYGGTSLLATMAGLGIVLGVRLRRRM